MTQQSPGGYTDLDLLKQITAQGMSSAPSIEKVLNRFLGQNPAFSDNEDLKLAIRHASVLTRHFITALTERVAHADPDHFSDGRDVVTTYEVGDGTYKHVWYANPADPINHPAPDHPAEALRMDSGGQLLHTFISGPQDVGVIPLGDPEDRA